MTGHHLLELSLFILVCILWKYNQEMHDEAKKWQEMAVEEQSKR